MDRRSLAFRVITAVVGIPLLLGAAWLGGWWWAAVIVFLGTVAALEFVRLVPGLTASAFLPGFGVVLLAMGSSLPGAGQVWLVAISAVMLFAAGILPPVMAGAPQRAGWLGQPGRAQLVGLTYIGVPSGVLIRWGFSAGFMTLLWLFVVIWVNDIAAYFVGHTTGRHKLAPEISPGKSWEGAIAGLAAGIAVSWGLARFLPLFPWQAAIAGGLITVSAQLGDLFESAIKRRAGVKDSGVIFPGHGGVLDRFDGVFAAAPVAYLLLELWAR